MMFDRKLLKDIIPFLEDPQALFILGPRRAGKTTLLNLLKRYISNAPIYYYDLERISDLETFSNGAEYFIKRFMQAGGDLQKKNFIMIDEIQHLKDFASFVKIIVDHHSESFKLILSGSSSAQIKLQFSDSLVGRKFVFNLFPLDFSEFLLFKGYDSWSEILSKNFESFSKDPLSTYHQELKILFEDYLKFGGYPEVVIANSEKKKFAFLAEITNTYLNKDIQSLNLIDDIIGFNKMTKRLALSCGSLLNLNEVSNDLNLSIYLCKKYIQILESTFIITTSAPFFQNKVNEIKKMSKLYFIDNGLRNYLIQQFQPLDERMDKGSVIENFVFSEIHKHSDAGEQIQFWRTKNNQEVDIIISRGSELIPIEVKSGKKKTSHIKKFMEFYQQTKEGYVIYKGKYLVEGNITYLPFWLV